VFAPLISYPPTNVEALATPLVRIYLASQELKPNSAYDGYYAVIVYLHSASLTRNL